MKTQFLTLWYVAVIAIVLINLVSSVPVDKAEVDKNLQPGKEREGKWGWGWGGWGGYGGWGGWGWGGYGGYGGWGWGNRWGGWWG